MLRISPFHHVSSSGLGLASPLGLQWIQLEKGGVRVTEQGAWGPLVLLEDHSGASLTNVNDSQVGRWWIQAWEVRGWEKGKGKCHCVPESQDQTQTSTFFRVHD